MFNYQEDDKRIDPKNFQCCGLGIEEIATFSTIIRSFRGYTDEEMKLADMLRPVLEKMHEWKYNKIKSTSYSKPGMKTAKLISSRSEILAMMMAYAYRELELEPEVWKWQSKHLEDPSPLTDDVVSKIH